MQRPGFAINNPVLIKGPAKLTYRSYRSVNCDPRSDVVNVFEASVGIEAPSAHACLTPSDISRWLPEATFEQATDGVSLMRYAVKGPQGQQIAAEFGFFMGTPCSTGVDVRQWTVLDARYQAAKQVHDRCLLAAKQRYCKAHPDITFEARDMGRRDVMDEDALGKCPALDTIYQKTPIGAVPERYEEYFNPAKTVCASIDARIAAMRAASPVVGLPKPKPPK